MMTVSVCIIAYNEENVINDILNNIKSQDYPHDKLEIVLVNNNSNDNTECIMNEFAKQNNDFLRVVVKTNGSKSQASGWNVAIREASGEVIIRIDAHASVPQDFVKNNIECIETGEDITGGPRPNIIDKSTPWKETLLLAESSMFGSSIAGYRRNHKKTYVNSMFHAAYRKEVFENVGLFNENLGRTEDNELHYRIRQAGYKLCFSPEIISYQHIRSSLKSMLRQKYLNGYWIGLTLGVCPQCLSLYHFVPFAFILAIIVTNIMCIIAVVVGTVTLKTIVFYIIGLMWGLYGLVAVVMTFVAIITTPRKQRNMSNIILPFLFFLLHISYGIGTMKGLIKMPSFVKGIKYNGTDKKR